MCVSDSVDDGVRVACSMVSMTASYMDLACLTQGNSRENQGFDVSDVLGCTLHCCTQSVFLGWILTRVAGGFDMAVNPELARVFAEDARLDHGGKVADRVSNETRVSAVHHAYYRTQVDRLLFYAVNGTRYAIRGHSARQCCPRREACTC